MEASLRIPNFSRLILSKQSLKFPPNRTSSPLSFPSPRHSNHLLFTNHYVPPRIKCLSQSSSTPSPISNPLSFLLSLSQTQLFNTHTCNVPFDGVMFDSKQNHFSWNRAPLNVDGGGNLGFGKEKGPVFTVVMLGWLGAEQKHLKRYIELYTSKGIDAVSMVIPVKDLLAFDLGTRVEERIMSLTEELISWLSETEKDGRQRGLLFHTFSNTGWFTYGAILNYLQSRGEFMDKIKGCVVDSAPIAELDPQVWAAGFSAALLKKRSTATLAQVVAKKGDKDMPKMQNTERPLVETLLLSVLEKVFAVVFKLPDVNRRLTKITSTLLKNQPSCPQLYLYSTGDTIIDSDRVELFIQSQKLLGRKVWAYNFGSSPHVDHYRKFPDVYSAEVQRFLKECLATVGHR